MLIVHRDWSLNLRWRDMLVAGRMVGAQELVGADRSSRTEREHRLVALVFGFLMNDLHFVL